ncbi:MAG: response regulator [Phototrophicaceae bacterium]
MDIQTLIINSNIMAGVTLKNALEQTGQFEVFPFSDASAALEFLKSNRHDVAVVEFGIPLAPGAAVVQRLQTLQSDLIIIANVANAQQMTEAERAGVSATLPNPYTARDLVDLLKALLPADMFKQSKPSRPTRTNPFAPSMGEPIKEPEATETSSALFEWLASEEPDFPAFEDNATITDLMSSIQRDALAVFTSTQPLDEWVEMDEDQSPHDDTPAKQLLQASQNPAIPVDSIPLDELIARVRGMTQEMPLVKEPGFIKGSIEERVLEDGVVIVRERGMTQEMEKVREPNFLGDAGDDPFNQVTRPSSVQARLIRSELTATEPIDAAVFQSRFDHPMRPTPSDSPSEQETVPPTHPAPFAFPPTPIAEQEPPRYGTEGVIEEYDAQDESDLFSTEPDANEVHLDQMLDVALRLEQTDLLLSQNSRLYRDEMLRQQTDHAQSIPELEQGESVSIPIEVPSYWDNLVLDSSTPDRAVDFVPNLDSLVKRDSSLQEPSVPPVDFAMSEINFDEDVPILLESALLQFATRDAEQWTPRLTDSTEQSNEWTPPLGDNALSQTAQEFEAVIAPEESASLNFNLAESTILEAEEERTVAQLALNFTQISMETAAEATILTRHKEAVAYAGALTATQIQELIPSIVDLTPSLAVGQAQMRFVTLPSNGQNYMLYTRLTQEDYLLTMVFSGNTPLKEIRQQSQRLLNALRAVPMSEWVSEATPLEQQEVAPLPAIANPPTPSMEGMLTQAPLEPPSAGNRNMVIRNTMTTSVESFNKFTFVWLLHDTHHLINPPTAEAIQSGLRIQLVERGWQIEHVEVTQDYVYIVLDLPANEVPQNAIQLLQKRAAQIAYKQDPYLDVEHLWADSYLMVAPGRRLSNQEILQYINFYHI